MNDVPSPAHAMMALVDLSVIRFHVRLSRRCRMGHGFVFFVVNARVSACVRRVSLSVGASLAYGWMDRRDRLPKKTKEKKRPRFRSFVTRSRLEKIARSRPVVPGARDASTAPTAFDTRAIIGAPRSRRGSTATRSARARRATSPSGNAPTAESAEIEMPPGDAGRVHRGRTRETHLRNGAASFDVEAWIERAGADMEASISRLRALESGDTLREK